MKNLLINLIIILTTILIITLDSISQNKEHHLINQDFKSREGKWFKDILEKDILNPETI